jgi:membrane fusion protein (multidrug efflux system)
METFSSSSKRIVLPVLVLLLLVLLGGWYWNMNIRGFISTDDAIIDSYQSTISAKIIGKIQDLLVKENTKVQTGQLLVQLDNSDLIAQEKQAKAALTSAEQNVNLAKINLAKAQDDFIRADSQYKGNFLSKQDYDHSKNALDASRAQYSIALAQVNTAQSQLGIVENQLQNTLIQSPINGVISKRWVMPGDVVQPSQPIFSIFDVQDVWITANFEETKLAKLHVNEPAQVKVDAYPDHSFKGYVSEIGNNTASQFALIPANNASGNFTKVTQRIPVKIAIENHPASMPLLPGMSVEVKVKVR